jgi:hypothetical protein
MSRFASPQPVLRCYVFSLSVGHTGLAALLTMWIDCRAKLSRDAGGLSGRQLAGVLRALASADCSSGARGSE